MAGDSTWYDKLRNQYRPERLEWLLVAESPPDPRSGERRFFYAPTLSYDNLYRSVAAAVYGERPGFNVYDKLAVLEELQRDGFWLIDAVQRPINKASSRERRAAIAASVPGLVERCLELSPRRGVIICHSPTYAAAAAALRQAGVPLLHSEPIPFPLGNWRGEFIVRFRKALAAGA